jgi:type IV pilus assembly protein PilY1
VHGDVISSGPTYDWATKTVYVGANDGLLHAIDAANGNELFSYLPNVLFPKLYKLTQTSYAHDYYVDGEIAVSTSFHTPGKSILVGALGRGGKGLYALDVTAPSTFSASKVLWEYTDSDLGLVLGKPIDRQDEQRQGRGHRRQRLQQRLRTRRAADHRPRDRRADPQDRHHGRQRRRHQRAGIAQRLGCRRQRHAGLLYIGDLLGNLWKFDLTSGTPADWGSSFGTAGAPIPFFVAVDGNGVAQPITGMPGLGINARKGDANFGKRYVFFGTGRYITSSDVTNTQTMSWYGLIDNGAAIQRPHRPETAQHRDRRPLSAAGPARAFSLATAGDMAGKKGWYIDLASPTNGALGERMIGEHKHFGEVLLATSMTPTLTRANRAARVTSTHRPLYRRIRHEPVLRHQQ